MERVHAGRWHQQEEQMEGSVEQYRGGDRGQAYRRREAPKQSARTMFTGKLSVTVMMVHEDACSSG